MDVKAKMKFVTRQPNLNLIYKQITQIKDLHIKTNMLKKIKQKKKKHKSNQNIKQIKIKKLLKETIVIITKQLKHQQSKRF